MERKLLVPAVLLVVLCTAAMLTGCQYAVLSIGSKTGSAWNCKFQLKGGTERHTINIPEGGEPEIRFNVALEEGTLAVLITDGGGDTVYESTESESTSFTVPLPETGKYQIALTTSKASGSYDITWGDPPAESEGESE